MFGDTDLPLALIMEEILRLGEEAPGQRTRTNKKRPINKNDRGGGSVTSAASLLVKPYRFSK